MAAGSYCRSLDRLASPFFHRETFFSKSCPSLNSPSRRVSQCLCNRFQCFRWALVLPDSPASLNGPFRARSSSRAPRLLQEVLHTLDTNPLAGHYQFSSHAAVVGLSIAGKPPNRCPSIWSSRQPHSPLPVHPNPRAAILPSGSLRLPWTSCVNSNTSILHNLRAVLVTTGIFDAIRGS